MAMKHVLLLLGALGVSSGDVRLEQCEAVARPLLTQTETMVPADDRQLTRACKNWRLLAECVRSFIPDDISRRHQRRYRADLPTAGRSVELMCDDPQYRAEYLRHAPCIRQLMTQPDRCAGLYTNIARAATELPGSDRRLCCEYGRFRECMSREAERGCPTSPGGRGRLRQLVGTTLGNALQLFARRCQRFQNDPDLCFDGGRQMRLLGGQTDSRSHVSSRPRYIHDSGDRQRPPSPPTSRSDRRHNGAPSISHSRPIRPAYGRDQRPQRPHRDDPRSGSAGRWRRPVVVYSQVEQVTPERERDRVRGRQWRAEDTTESPSTYRREDGRPDPRDRLNRQERRRWEERDERRQHRYRDRGQSVSSPAPPTPAEEQLQAEHVRDLTQKHYSGAQLGRDERPAARGEADPQPARPQTLDDRDQEREHLDSRKSDTLPKVQRKDFEPQPETDREHSASEQIDSNSFQGRHIEHGENRFPNQHVPERVGPSTNSAGNERGDEGNTITKNAPPSDIVIGSDSIVLPISGDNADTIPDPDLNTIDVASVDREARKNTQHQTQGELHNTAQRWNQARFPAEPQDEDISKPVEKSSQPHTLPSTTPLPPLRTTTAYSGWFRARLPDTRVWSNDVDGAAQAAPQRSSAATLGVGALLVALATLVGLGGAL